MTRFIPLWVGARGTEFDWKYIQMSLESNINLVSMMKYAGVKSQPDCCRTLKGGKKQVQKMLSTEEQPFFPTAMPLEKGALHVDSQVHLISMLKQ